MKGQGVPGGRDGHRGDVLDSGEQCGLFLGLDGVDGVLAADEDQGGCGD